MISQRLWWLGFSLSAVLAFTSAVSSGAAAREGASVATAQVTAAVQVGKPVTVDVEVPASMRPLLETVAKGNKEKRTVRLTLEAVKPEPSSDLSLRVFLNNPGATADTAATGPTHIGTAAFFPQEKAPVAKDYLLDLTSSVEAMGRAGSFNASGPLKITLIALPAAAKKDAKGSIAVKKVSTEVVD